METKLAATFLTVAEIGNITRSAEQLGYSQAAVTVQMKQLEDGLGVRLFDRIGRGIQLTDAGRAFIPYAQALMKASNDADSFAMDREDPEGTLTLECSSSLVVGRLSDQIIRFRRKYPKIKIVVRTSDNVDSMIGGLKENVIDFVFVTNRREEYPGCVRFAEVKERFVFVTHPDDAEIYGSSMTLEEMFDDRFISSFIVSDRNVSYVHSLEQELAEKGIIIEPMLDFSSTSAIVNIIKRGYGHSLLPEYLVARELERGELVKIDTEELDLDIWSQLYYNSNKWINPQMQAFIDFMEEEVNPET